VCASVCGGLCDRVRVCVLINVNLRDGEGMCEHVWREQRTVQA